MRRGAFGIQCGCGWLVAGACRCSRRIHAENWRAEGYLICDRRVQATGCGLPTQTRAAPGCRAGRTGLRHGRAGRHVGPGGGPGLHDSGPADTMYKRAAGLCISAGAGMVLIERGRREATPRGVTRG